MPIVRMYRRGAVASTPSAGNRKPPIKTSAQGWSEKSGRDFRNALLSIDEACNAGCFEYAVTLTQRLNPPTAQSYQTVRQAWLMRQRRGGMVRYIWCVEAQRRGVVHLHLYVVTSVEIDEEAMLDDWLELAAAWGPGRKGQMAEPVENAVGYQRYLEAHAWRTVKDYQRRPENWPLAWRESGSLGRPWAISGGWGQAEPVDVLLTDPEWWIWRRLERSRQRAVVRPQLNLTPGPDWGRWVSWMWREYGAFVREHWGQRADRRAEKLYRRERINVQGARHRLREPNEKVSRVKGMAAWGSGWDLVDAARRIAREKWEVRRGESGTQTGRKGKRGEGTK